MPTGLVGAGEDACEACAREVLEETGVAVDVGCLVAVRELHQQPRRAQAARPPKQLGQPKPPELRGQSGAPAGGSDQCTSTNSFYVFLCTVKAGASHSVVVPQASEIAACQWMEPDAFLASQATLMPPGSLYYELNRTALGAAARAAAGGGQSAERSTVGLVSRSMPMGFRPGSNRVYMIEGQSSEKKSEK
jgi:8-oxo-dGTP pyrophosphatase MutT (NUDIX family)